MSVDQHSDQSHQALDGGSFEERMGCHVVSLILFSASREAAEASVEEAEVGCGRLGRCVQTADFSFLLDLSLVPALSPFLSLSGQFLSTFFN